VAAIYFAGVILKVKARRRWFGALCLLTAIGMLVGGETALQGRLSPTGFVVYWAGCLVAAAFAALTALVDAARIRAESQTERRALIEETLRKIESGKAGHRADRR
jgi:4-hydroxybenzoate polyprenyltransferase